MNGVYFLLLLIPFAAGSGDPGGSEPKAPLHTGHSHPHGVTEQHREDKSLSTLPVHEAIQYKSVL